MITSNAKSFMCEKSLLRVIDQRLRDSNRFDKFLKIDWNNRDFCDASANENESSEEILDLTTSLSRLIEVNNDRSKVNTN